MFTELEALVIIKFIKEQRQSVEREIPDVGPAQAAYYTLIRVSALLAEDAHMNAKDVFTEIVPKPTELVL